MAVEERSFEIINQLGMHARPAAAFVKVASEFACEIIVSKDGVPVNGKSILGVLTLAAEQGASLTIRAEGNDATEALEALGSLIENGFNE
jgi:phosphocarrier protein HPr